MSRAMLEKYQFLTQYSTIALESDSVLNGSNVIKTLEF